LDWKDMLRVLGAFACFLFALSIFHPFLQVQLFDIVTFSGYPGPETFWSFKVINVYFRTPNDSVIKEYWFADYWYRYTNYRTMELGLGIGTVFVFMFGVQVLAMLFAALAAFNVKAYLFLSSAVLSFFTTFCMWLVSRAFIYPYYRYVFQAGFWLTFPSVMLFFTCSILSWKLLRKKAAHSITQLR